MAETPKKANKINSGSMGTVNRWLEKNIVCTRVTANSGAATTHTALFPLLRKIPTTASSRSGNLRPNKSAEPKLLRKSPLPIGAMGPHKVHNEDSR